MSRALPRVLLALVLGCAATLAAAQATLPEAALVKALRGGGHVIVFRHGATNPDQADTDPLSVEQPGNEAKQRHLSDKGRTAARGWNEAFKRLGIPVGKVYSSKFHRAVETARLAFGEPATTFDVTEGGLVVSPNENNRRTAALRKLAATPPEAGTNTVIVTHKPNIVDAFGKDWFDVKEGEASVFKPDGKGGFQAEGRVLSDQWTVLAARSSK
jgi:broad specificity phosphatase PhoE